MTWLIYLPYCHIFSPPSLSLNTFSVILFIGKQGNNIHCTLLSSSRVQLPVSKKEGFFFVQSMFCFHVKINSGLKNYPHLFIFCVDNEETALQFWNLLEPCDISLSAVTRFNKHVPSMARNLIKSLQLLEIS